MSAPFVMSVRRDLRTDIWRAIRTLNKERGVFTPQDIRGAMRGVVRLAAVRDYCARLLAGGYLARDEVRREWENGTVHVRAGFTLARDCGIDAPRLRKDGSESTQGRGRRQMWQAMRVLRRWTIRELLATASTDEVRIAASEAATYCLRLHQAGYLLREATDAYRLIPARATGPNPPQTLRDGRIRDANTGEIYAREQGAAHG